MKKLSLLFSLFCFLNLSIMAQEKATLIYVGDPMCSWCYGFAPEISKALGELGESIDFQLLMGGLRPYNTETMADLEEFLLHHWEDVAKRSGQAFKYEILKDHSFVYDTEPAARAVVVVRTLQPDAEFAFFKDIQTAFYAENKNTHEVATYLPLCDRYGIDQTAFKKAFASEEYKEKTRDDFKLSGALGVRGFPSLVVKKGGEYFLIANGYTNSEMIVTGVKTMLAQTR